MASKKGTVKRMPANVFAGVAAKIRAWTFPLLPGCTVPKATGALLHSCGFYT